MQSCFGLAELAYKYVTYLTSSFLLFNSAYVASVSGYLFSASSILMMMIG